MFGIAAGIALKLMETGLGPKAAKAIAWIGLLAVAGLLIWGAIWWFTDTVDDARDEGVKAGVTTERVEAQGKVIENVEAANETRAAANDPRSCVAYNECLRSARTAANCVRYLPDNEGCPIQPGTLSGR
ncbi:MULTISPECIES: hypothetical protein [Alphaproteobacteria]|uniref:hypothetical protein n=1 Tax=Sphingopyxis sp. TaxID=1908224 RepID=UPI004034DC2A